MKNEIINNDFIFKIKNPNKNDFIAVLKNVNFFNKSSSSKEEKYKLKIIKKYEKNKYFHQAIIDYNIFYMKFINPKYVDQDLLIKIYKRELSLLPHIFEFLPENLQENILLGTLKNGSYKGSQLFSLLWHTLSNERKKWCIKKNGKLIDYIDLSLLKNRKELIDIAFESYPNSFFKYKIKEINISILSKWLKNAEPHYIESFIEDLIYKSGTFHLDSIVLAKLYDIASDEETIKWIKKHKNYKNSATMILDEMKN